MEQDGGAGDCAPKHEGESKPIRKSRTTTMSLHLCRLPCTLMAPFPSEDEPGKLVSRCTQSLLLYFTLPLCLRGTSDKGDGEDGLVRLTVMAYLLGKDIRGAGQY
ncbi:hypothetical protein M8C21_020225 [Ambrosia artemisiifolia]|uniref:Uncharacterized protein n=1 Tax=Ambrosia artemisiifolia TaxID=4212 RepID=A0AAD5C0S4_AMBAR|nr:hypothetical protein M8C21_020225 [Ambrosia artemisiifolia]